MLQKGLTQSTLDIISYLIGKTTPKISSVASKAVHDAT